MQTSDIRGAGTDANVHLTLYGLDADSGAVPLTSSETHTDKFERGHTDVFEIVCRELGPLHKVQVGHDNSGLFSAW